MNKIEGIVHKYGNDINTDYIIPSHRKRDITEINILVNYAMEDIDPEFANKVNPGDIIAAGENFGCGSAMEVAVDVLIASGIRAILAKSFARLFYRNAVNKGLLVIGCDTEMIDDKDCVSIDTDRKGKIKLINKENGKIIEASIIPVFILELLNHGGIINYVHKYPMLYKNELS